MMSVGSWNFTTETHLINMDQWKLGKQRTRIFLISVCKNYLKRSFCQLTKARWKIKIEAWALSGRPTLLKRLGPSKQCCINFPQEKVVEKVWDKKLTISYDPSFVYFFMEICCWWTRLNNNGANCQILYLCVDPLVLHWKCSNWHWISKLSLNFGCLFTFCYLDGANYIKTDLHICNLWTGQFVSYKSVV